jgi:hypothetical protein
VAAKEVTATAAIRSASWRGFKKLWQIDLHKMPTGPKSSASRTAGDEKEQGIVGFGDGGMEGDRSDWSSQEMTVVGGVDRDGGTSRCRSKCSNALTWTACELRSHKTSKSRI